MSSLLDEWFVTQSLWDPETHWDGPKSLKHICNENTVHRNNLYILSLPSLLLLLPFTVKTPGILETVSKDKLDGWTDIKTDTVVQTDRRTEQNTIKKVDMIYELTFWRQAGCQTNQTVWQLVEQEDGGSHRGWNQTSEVHSVAAGEQKRLVMTESFIIHRDTCIVYTGEVQFMLPSFDNSAALSTRPWL